MIPRLSNLLDNTWTKTLTDKKLSSFVTYVQIVNVLHFAQSSNRLCHRNHYYNRLEAYQKMLRAGQKT